MKAGRFFSTHVKLDVYVTIYSDEPILNEEAILIAQKQLPDPDSVSEGISTDDRGVHTPWKAATVSNKAEVLR